MALILLMLSLLAGTTKCVSVCGINSAQVAQPHVAKSRVALIAYFAALIVGTTVLVVGLTAFGRLVGPYIGMDATSRITLFGLTFAFFGTAELLLGPRLLPHVAWAVPKSWPERRYLGLPAFGLVRGLAIFNHSPFLSMHMWILALVLLPDAAPPVLLTAALALGLGFWSVLYGATAAVQPGKQDQLFRSVTERSIRATPLIARLDGLSLIAVGVIALALAA